MKTDKDKNSRTFLFVIFIILSAMISWYSKSNAQIPYYLANPYPAPYFSAYYPFPTFPAVNPYYFPTFPVPIQSFGITTPPVSLTPLSTVSSPIASISGLLTDLLFLGSTAVSITPVTVDFLINTGNPQVDSVLSLIASNPSLLDYPLFLDSLINTGNPEVAFYLSLLSLSY